MQRQRKPGFKLAMLGFVPQPSLPKLQLADLTCHPIGRHLLKPQQKNRAYEVVEKKFRRGGVGNIMGYGLKVFP